MEILYEAKLCVSACKETVGRLASDSVGEAWQCTVVGDGCGDGDADDADG